MIICISCIHRSATPTQRATHYSMWSTKSSSFSVYENQSHHTHTAGDTTILYITRHQVYPIRNEQQHKSSITQTDDEPVSCPRCVHVRAGITNHGSRQDTMGYSPSYSSCLASDVRTAASIQRQPSTTSTTAARTLFARLKDVAVVRGRRTA
jgi:hypothetical protein